METDSGVHRTLDAFTRLGWWGVIGGKFVPGMSVVMPPLAGMARVAVGRYLILDTVGSLLYCGFFILLARTN
jgi:membrane protein DedA with SNARE-associated domain